ncbi:HEAT repeat domain-containing protein [Microcoleus sp. FACHB-1515]|uniref:HEAT repeat domain-containing protein n=1 Tax=Cyanophyceae TaxID=3028117 RepID=UPI001685575E|nr:HEAT repeat domain-containing protein [Microcoleus sp. FACHB-1515]MBD2090512.1 HEAT repeat domain-containing protein [Microcoleus sp. FACHB-1515]
MTKFRRLEDAQTAILQIQADPGANLETLRCVLDSKHPVAIAQAAKLIASAELVELQRDLAESFDRLFTKSSDPGCIGKQAIADALYRLEFDEAELFLRGIQHVQMEPVWGGQVDSAPKLRGVCALGLVRMNYPDVLNELADLLADPEPEARIGAARAVAYSDRPEGVALLRLRIRLGDDAAVMAEYFDALLKLAFDGAIVLVSSFLSGSEALQEAAALSLGSSRSIAALPPLKTWWQQCRTSELRQTALLAIAMLRHDQAIDFLVDQIAAGISRDAKEAIAALRIYQQDLALWKRVEQTAAARGDRSLLEAIRTS